MWEIVQNEWRYYARTPWLVGISMGFLATLFLTVFLGNRQVAIQTENYQSARRLLRSQWENIQEMNPHGAAHYGTYAFKPANILSSLDEGVQGVTGNVLRVEGHVQNEIVHSEASQMQSISKFGKLKSSLLLQYIIPVMLIFLAFGSISQERQSGRLKLLLLQGTKPLPLLLGKTLAVWGYGLALLALTVLTYLLINLQRLDANLLSRTVLLLVAYGIYFFVLSGLTVFLSARWQSSTLALTTMLGLWMIWSVFLPNILMSSVEKSYPLPSRTDFKAAMREDRSKGIDGHNPSDEREKELEKEVLAKYGVEKREDLPINFDGLVMQADEDYGNKVWDKHFGNIREVMSNQKRMYQLGGLLNPFISLQNASMGFSASDNLHHQAFLLQVENYRRDFIKMLNDKHAYGGSRTGDWDWKADNAFYASVPDFTYEPTTLASVFSTYLADLAILLCWVLLTYYLLTLGAKKINIL